MRGPGWSHTWPLLGPSASPSGSRLPAARLSPCAQYAPVQKALAPPCHLRSACPRRSLLRGNFPALWLETVLLGNHSLFFLPPAAAAASIIQEPPVSGPRFSESRNQRFSDFSAGPDGQPARVVAQRTRDAPAGVEGTPRVLWRGGRGLWWRTALQGSLAEGEPV